MLHGRKDLVRDAHRAGAWVVHARTAPGPGRSAFLLEPGLLPADAVRTLPRAPASGLRGTPLSALEFTHCPLPADTLLGRPREGTALALRTFQLDRCLVAGAAVAAPRPYCASPRTPCSPAVTLGRSDGGTPRSPRSSPTCWPATAWPSWPCAR
ncbi:hypothetical protein [Streptomyces sampsonii]|uniref:hypothetical protein n=1 Tax=Streptomyces sampsonii TaxID=42239 RepID=UPI0013315B5E|nr:hypothetical protein [Streptomyces sampsonii]